MALISLDIDTKPVERRMTQDARRQLPFAMALTLTTLAKQAQAAEKEEMKRVFDRPTRWTLNAVRIQPATKRSLQSRVFLVEDASKGTAAADYLAPQILGGRREQKRYERRLSRAGVLPRGWVTVPGEAVPRNKYGNVSQGRIVQMLSAARAFGESGYDANPTGSARSRRAQGRSGADRMFVSRGRGMWFGRRQTLPAGIWQRMGRGGRRVRPLLLFVRAASYSPRFDFQGVASKVVRGNFEEVFVSSLRRAMGNA
jgi:hypothetical protein